MTGDREREMGGGGRGRGREWGCGAGRRGGASENGGCGEMWQQMSQLSQKSSALGERVEDYSVYTLKVEFEGFVCLCPCVDLGRILTFVR